MSTRLLLLPNLNRLLITCKAPHEYIVKHKPQPCTRAIVVGVSVYYTSDLVFTRYFDQTTKRIETLSEPRSFTLNFEVPWLTSGDNETAIIEVPCQLSMGKGKKFVRVKLDMVFSIKDGVIPPHYLAEVYRDGTRTHSFLAEDHVYAAVHFVIL